MFTQYIGLDLKLEKDWKWKKKWSVGLFDITGGYKILYPTHLALCYWRQWFKIPQRELWLIILHPHWAALSAENIINNVNKELDGLSRSFVTGCLHNVRGCFSSDFLDVMQELEIGTQRSTSRHTNTPTHMCVAQQRTRLSLHKQRLSVPKWDVCG